MFQQQKFTSIFLIPPMDFHDNLGRELAPGMDFYTPEVADAIKNGEVTTEDIERMVQNHCNHIPYEEDGNLCDGTPQPNLPVAKAENLENEIPPTKQMMDFSKFLKTESDRAPQSQFANPNMGAAEGAVHRSISLPTEESLITKPKGDMSGFQAMEQYLRRRKVISIGKVLFMYDGRAYVPRSKEAVLLSIVDTCREVIASKGRSFVDGVYNLLLVEPRIHREESDIQRNLVAFSNGVLDLDTGTMYGHSPQLLITNEILAKYLPHGEPTPLFDRFIFDVTGGDDNLRQRILEAIGYTLTSDTAGKCFFLLQGVGNSGKSVLTRLIQNLHTKDATVSLDLSEFSGKFSIASLQLKSVCICPDLPAGHINRTVVSKLKQLSGNDLVSSDVKYSDRTTFRCTARCIMATNHAFYITDNDPAFEGRICVIPFRYAIPKERQIHSLDDALFAERNGIVSQAINAYFGLRSRAYQFSGFYHVNEVVSSAGGLGMGLEENISAFLYQNFVKEENAIVFISDAHQLFIRGNGYVAPNVFSEKFTLLAEKLFGATKTRKRPYGGSGNPLSCLLGISYKGGNNNDLPVV